MIRRIFKALPLLLLLALFSCRVEMPEYVIPPDKMGNVLYDYHMVQSMSVEYASDSYKEKLFFDYVFKKHNVTKQEFDSSLVWYNRYPKHMFKIYSELEERLEKEVELMGDAKGMLDEGVSLNVAFLATDTAELWTSATNKMLLATPLHSSLSFSFETSDTAFVPGDSLSFEFYASFMPGRCDSVGQGAYAAVVVDYADGTSVNRGVTIAESGPVVLQLDRNYNSRLKSMRGFVYYCDDDSTASSRMLLTGLSVKRIHPAVEEGEDDKKEKRRGGITGRDKK